MFDYHLFYSESLFNYKNMCYYIYENPLCTHQSIFCRFIYFFFKLCIWLMGVSISQADKPITDLV